MKRMYIVIFILLLAAGLLPAQEPSWTDALIKKVSEIDSRFYGAAARKLDLWEETGKDTTQAGEAYSPEELYEHTLEENRELALLNVERNKILIEQKGAKAQRLPTLDFEAALTNIANPLDPISLTAGELGVLTLTGEEILIPPEDMTIWEGMEGANYDFKLIIEQPVFTWGKIKSAVEAAAIASEAGALRIESKRSELRTKIYAIMHALFFLSKIEEVLELQEQVSGRLIEITENSYENGFILYSDLLEARIQAKELEIARVRLETEKSNLLVDLSYTCGIEDLQISDLDFSSLSGTPEDIAIESRGSLIEKALAGNPNLQLLEQMRQIQALRQRIAEGENYLKPDFGLHFELSYSGSRFPFIETDWYGQDRWNLTSTLGFSTTVFDGGKLVSSILKETQATEASMYEFEKGVQTIAKTVTETLLKLELSLRNLEYYQLKSENGKAQLELKQTQFESGAGSEADYLMQKIDVYTAIIEYYRECINFFTQLYTLDALTGES